MNKIDCSQLSHPELLSEATLREIIETSSIALPAFENLTKEELIEIFKRLALPMPQRQYDRSRHLGRILNDLRTKNGVQTADYTEITDHRLSNNLPTDNQDRHVRGICKAAAKNRPRPTTQDHQPSCKKNRFSNYCHSVTSFNDDAKRRIEDSAYLDSKKRQKITWP